MRLQEAVDKYLDDLGLEVKAGNKSPATVRTYRTGLRRYVQALGDPDLDDLDGNEVIEYMRGLAQEDLKPRTIELYLTAVSQFYQWMALEEVIILPANQQERVGAKMRKWRKGRKEKRLPRTPNEDAVQAVQDVAQTPAKGTHTTARAAQRARISRMRDAALFAFLRSTGARVSEVANALRDDLDLERKRAQVYGKGRKERVVFLDDAATCAIRAYLEARDAANLRRPTKGEEALFSRHDKRSGWAVRGMSPNSIRNALHSLCQEAGVEGFTPHQLRHRVGARAIGPLGIRGVQELLGHESPTTTALYTHVEPDALAEAFEELDL